MRRRLPGARLGSAAAAWLALCIVPVAASAAPTGCLLDAGVYACLLQHGDSTLEVRASSLDGGWVSVAMGVGDVFDLPLEAFKIWSFDDDEYIDVAVESATQDPVSRQIRVQVREVFSNAIRAVGLLTLTDEGDATVIDETISVENLVPQAVSGRLYVVTDFDLDFDVLDETIAVTQSGTRIEQRDGATTALLEVVGDPPTDWDVAPCCTLGSIAEGSFFELQRRNTAVGPADFQAAWSWDRDIGSGETVSFAVRKTHVPEPGGVASAAAALLSLAGAAAARSARQGRSGAPSRGAP